MCFIFKPVCPWATIKLKNWFKVVKNLLKNPLVKIAKLHEIRRKRARKIKVAVL